MPSRLTVVLVSLLLATSTVIIWLWLVIVPARVAILGPEECRCDPERISRHMLQHIINHYSLNPSHRRVSTRGFVTTK